jgi:hypothetical protein
VHRYTPLAGAYVKSCTLRVTNEHRFPQPKSTDLRKTAKTGAASVGIPAGIRTGQPPQRYMNFRFPNSACMNICVALKIANEAEEGNSPKSWQCSIPYRVRWRNPRV